MLLRGYALSPHTRLETGPPPRLVCDFPLQAVMLDDTALAVLNALQQPRYRGAMTGEVLEGLTPEWETYLEHLAARGFLRAEYRLVPCVDPPPVEVIVPVYDNPAGLARCLVALAGQEYPPARIRISVVDDASPQSQQELLAPLVESRPSENPPLQGLAGRLRWLRSPRNLGPASARNFAFRTPWRTTHAAGASARDVPPAGASSRDEPWAGASAPDALLAFIDSDCVPEPGWLAGLAAVLETPVLETAGLAAVGGRVIPLERTRLLGRFEGECSSLVLGDSPGPAGGPEHRMSYLPSCNLALRREAFALVGGFREGWRFGEDVDLSWRLADAGLALFYHPMPVVAHAFRVRWGPFLNRRRAYARSEAPLRALHPHRFRRGPPGGPWPVALPAAAAAGTGSPWWLLAALAVVTVQALGPLARPSPGMKAASAVVPAWSLSPWSLSARIRAGGRALAALPVHHGRELTRRTAIAWPPLLALLPALWPLAAAGFALGAAGEWLARRPRLRPWEFLAGYAAESLAYSLGRTEGLLLESWRRLKGWPRGEDDREDETPSPTL